MAPVSDQLAVTRPRRSQITRQCPSEQNLHQTKPRAAALSPVSCEPQRGTAETIKKSEVRQRAKGAMVGRGGLEPPTSRLSGVRSNHLSYRP